MPDSADSNLGRPRKELRSDIVALLEEADYRAMTLGMITDELDDGSRQSINNRLTDLVEEGIVEQQKIGNARAFWIPGSSRTFDVGGGSSEPTQMGLGYSPVILGIFGGVIALIVGLLTFSYLASGTGVGTATVLEFGAGVALVFVGLLLLSYGGNLALSKL